MRIRYARRRKKDTNLGCLKLLKRRERAGGLSRLKRRICAHSRNCWKKEKGRGKAIPRVMEANFIQKRSEADMQAMKEAEFEGQQGRRKKDVCSARKKETKGAMKTCRNTKKGGRKKRRKIGEPASLRLKKKSFFTNAPVVFREGKENALIGCGKRRREKEETDDSKAATKSFVRQQGREDEHLYNKLGGGKGGKGGGSPQGEKQHKGGRRENRIRCGAVLKGGGGENLNHDLLSCERRPRPSEGKTTTWDEKKTDAVLPLL